MSPHPIRSSHRQALHVIAQTLLIVVAFAPFGPSLANAATSISSTFSTFVDVAGGQVVTALAPVTPNPSLGRSLVTFSLGLNGIVDVSVYSLDGRRVKTLARGEWDAGSHRVIWDGTDALGNRLGPGIFYVRMVAGGARFLRKVALLR